MGLADVMRAVSTRIGRRVTQLELSKVCGVSQGQLSNLALGRQRGSEALLQKRVDYLSSIDDSKVYSISDIDVNTPVTQPMIAEKNGILKPVKLGQNFVTLPEVISIRV